MFISKHQLNDSLLNVLRKKYFKKLIYSFFFLMQCCLFIMMFDGNFLSSQDFEKNKSSSYSSISVLYDDSALFVGKRSPYQSVHGKLNRSNRRSSQSRFLTDSFSDKNIFLLDDRLIVPSLINQTIQNWLTWYTYEFKNQSNQNSIDWIFQQILLQKQLQILRKSLIIRAGPVA